jgi:hypothetical protein
LHLATTVDDDEDNFVNTTEHDNLDSNSRNPSNEDSHQNSIQQQQINSSNENSQRIEIKTFDQASNDAPNGRFLLNRTDVQ